MRIEIRSAGGELYDVLDRYKLDHNSTIEINSLEELINLSNELKQDIIIISNKYQEENSLLIYDDYLE